MPGFTIIAAMVRTAKFALALMCRPDFEHLHLDDVERPLNCASRTCHGPVRIAVTHDGKTEGFVGGMA